MRSAGASRRRASSSVEISAAEWAAMSLSRKGGRLYPSVVAKRSDVQIVFDGSGGTATLPLVGAGAGAGGDVVGASWPTSGCLAASVGVLVVFLVFFAVAVPAGLVDFDALSFFRQELRELEVLRLWQ